MKQTLLCVLFLCSVFAVNGQCDETLTAKAGTYKILHNPEKMDSDYTPYQLTNCSFLEQIELNRHQTQNIFIELGNFIIEIYSRDKELELKSQEL